MLDQYPDVMTVKHVREALGIGRDLAYEGVKSGQIPSVKIGGKYLVYKQSLIEMLEGKVNVGLHTPAEPG